jgi:hypothetical protein
MMPPPSLPRDWVVIMIGRRYRRNFAQAALKRRHMAPLRRDSFLQPKWPLGNHGTVSLGMVVRAEEMKNEDENDPAIRYL